ncbi:hypothetical protein CGC54_02515 [Capnocytophaga canimorsus]|uniref:HYR domain-containing protein n=1 Tax=Capnocytophaga canimorsus TaxID=28188 RepID=A0AAC9Z1Y5_9FLAO|nr:T9SS type B sorting domain-containing protein [Capnocytophaga canimorsus]ATA93289.1 hypothetical protein CGC54_02515 [Capnocytophaga canimorsus]
MKKFFIAICVFFVTFAVKAQCDLSDFTLNQVPGTCYGNAELTVSNPSCTSSTEILAELISPGNPSPKIEPLTGGSYTFSSLRAGTYTVTLSNQNTGVRGVSKSIEITTSYQNIVWQLNSIAAPTCSDGVNGRIQLKIISGGIGSFKVEVFDKLGNLVVSQNNIPKPTTGNTANIEFLGSDSNPLKSGDYSLQITDLAGGNLGCGAIIKLPIVIPPSTNSNTLCKLIERGELSYIQLGLDAAGDCKHRLKIQIKHPGTNVQLSTEAQNFYKQAGTAQVWNLTTNEGPIDISSTLEDALYIYRNHYTTPFMFKEGDKVRVLIKGAQNTIDETFILKDLDPNKPPFQERRLGWLGNDAQGAVRGWQITYVDKENTCREAYAFRLGQGVSHRIYKDDNDNSKEYKYRYHPWGMYEFDLDYANRATTGKTTPDPDKHWYKVEKLEAGAWTDVSHLVKWSRGKHSMPLTFDDFIADFTDAGAPTATNRTIRYRFTYQDTKIINSGPKGCFPSSPPVMEIDAYYKNNISNYLEGIMTNDWAIRYGYGAYEGTSAMYLATGQYTYVYPIKIKLEMLSRADGKALDAPFPMRLPFMNPEDVQMKVFDPVVEFEGITPEHNFFGYGDFPAGQYRLTITDACGNSHSIIKDFDKYLKYDDKITIDQGCGNGSVTFDVGAKDHRTGEVISQISESIRVGITKKNHLDSWNYFQYATRPVYTTPNGVFSNLPPGDYKILLRGLYHAIHYTNTNNRFASNGFTSAVVPPGVYVWVSMESRMHHQSSYSKIISIQPAVSQLQAEVESTFCDPNTNTGIVNATITSPQDIIRYPLTFELRKKADASLVDSHTYDGTNTETSHTFTNVDEGVYVVIIKHECGSNEFETEVKLSNFRQPSIFLNRTNDCPGTPVTLRLSASETLFDIEWYRLEGANRIILGNGNTITQSPTTTTTYYAEYALKPGIGCASTAPATAQRIVRVKDDNTPPTILNCPSDIEVFAEIGKCTAQVYWTEPTASDDCTQPPLMTQTHHSGDVFDIGTHTVNYVFKDIAGNTATCTFNVTVKARSVNLQTHSRYTDGAGNTITQLNIGQQFFYEISYQNVGQENIRNTTLSVTLPDHPLVEVSGTPDMNDAAPGGIAPTYTVVGNVYTFTLPQGSLLTGGNPRAIRIALQLKGNCTDLGKPCANYLKSQYQFQYEGGNQDCAAPPQTQSGEKDIQVATESCIRSELFCPGDTMTLTAAEGFTTYRWYKDGVLIPSATTNALVVNTPGVYRVEKQIECQGVTVVSTETINYVATSSVTDPLRPIADGGAVCTSNGQWTSHFILCNEPQRQITLNYVNTPNIEWQKLNTGCNNLGFNCPNPDNGCWTTFHNGTSFIADQTGEYRLKISTATGCDAFFYFNVYKNNLEGQVTQSDYTDYQPGHINIEMETVGLEYTYVLKNTAGQVVAGPVTKTNVSESWRHTFGNLQEGDYVVEVSSPQLPNSCIFTQNVRINKVTKLTMKATFIAWTGCNEVKIRFEAQGGKQPYKFAIWSIDGVALYNDFVNIPASAFIATIAEGESYVEALIPNITQPGRYLFVVQDQDQRSALQTQNEAILIEPEGLYGFRFDLTHIACGSNPDSGAVQTHFERQQNRTTKLYRIDTNANRVYIDTNSTGIYTGLIAGNYEMEISIVIGTETCIYKKPFTINEAENTLKAFAGVVEDIACDTQTPAGYKVSINNVSGGTGGYQYDFGKGYSASNVGYVSGSTTVYVKDSAGCTLPLEVVITPTEIPAVSFTPVSYNCNGYGTFTVTTLATTPLMYQYQVDDLPKQDAPVIGPLAPRATPYNITVHYTPAPGAGTTPNYLFKEDFGSGDDLCDGTILYLGCKTNEALEDGFYTITQQVAPNAQWVNPTPTDASGVANGRYLAVMQQTTNGNSGIIYHKTIGNIVANENLYVSVKLHNLLATSLTAGTHPHIVLDFVAADGSLIARRDLGVLPASGNWQTLSATFNATDLTGVTQASFQIRNISPGATLGNDLALDDIVIWQNTKYCKAEVSKPVIIEAGKEMATQLLSTLGVRCVGDANGSLQGKITAGTLPTSVEYSIDNQNTWTTIAVAPDGTFSVSGLQAVNGALLYVRDPNDTACVSAFNYSISAPQTMSITTQIIKKIDCQTAPHNGATVKATASGGTKPYLNYQYKLSSATSWTSVVPTQNEALLTHLTAGDYHILVTDQNGCTQSATFTIEDKRQVVFDAIETYCYQGGNSAKIAIQVQDGNSTQYQYSSDGGTSWTDFTQATYEFTHLSAGTYDIWVRDQLGCSSNTTVVIAPQLQMEVRQTQDLDCLGNDAIFELSALGGKGTKTFSVSTDNGNTFTIIPALTATTARYTTNTSGNFIFKVQDEIRPDGFTRCQALSKTYKVSNEPPRWKPDFTIGKKDVACAGEATGQILASINDIDTNSGQAPYTINVYEDDGTGNPIKATQYGLFNLQAKKYVVIIEDAKGCESVPTPIEIGQTPALNLTITPTQITCVSGAGISLGKVDITLGTGGTAPFEVKIFKLGTAGMVHNATTNNNETITKEGLNFGDYHVVITDATHCQKVEDFSISAYTDIIITATPTTQPIGCTAGSGAIEVSAYNTTGNAIGTGNFYFAVYTPGLTYTPGDPQWHLGTAATINLPAGGSAPGATYEFTNLTPGVTYVFAVYDQDTKCMYFQPSTLAVPTQSTLKVDDFKTENVKCQGESNGKATFSLSGQKASTTSINYQVFTYPDNTPVGAVQNRTAPYSNITVGGLSAGEYYIVFTEMHNANEDCVNATAPFKINQPLTQLNVTAQNPIAVNCKTNSGRIVTTVSGGVAPYQYIYNTTGTAPTHTDWATTTDSSVKQVSTAGTWYVFVKDQAGCVKQVTSDVAQDPAPQIASVSVDDLCSASGKYTLRVKLTQKGTGTHYYRLNGAVPTAVDWINTDSFLITEVLPSTTPYSIQVIDGNDCSDNTHLTVNAPITFQVKIDKTLDCSATPDASIKIENISGGNGTYFYSIDRVVLVDDPDNPTTPAESYVTHTPRTSVTLTPITVAINKAGDYVVHVFDNQTATCPVKKRITIEAKKQPKMTITAVTDEKCHSGTLPGTGSISVAVANNGEGPFNIEITQVKDLATGIITPLSQTPILGYNATFNGLKGSQNGMLYTIKATAQANKCTHEIEQIIVAPPALNIAADALTASEYTCLTTPKLPTLSLDLSKISGGTPPYTRFVFVDQTTGAVLQDSNATTYTLAHLNGGSFYLTLYDANGCDISTPPVTIAPTLLIDKINVGVNTAITCVQDEIISVSITTTPAYASITPQPNIVYTISDALSGSTIHTQSVATTTYTFPALPVGQYLIKAQNQITQCEVATTHTVLKPDTFIVSPSDAQAVTCHEGDNGSIKITFVDTFLGDGDQALLGFSYQIVNAITDAPVHSQTLPAGTTHVIYNNLQAGTYKVRATSTHNQCHTPWAQFSIRQSQTPIAITAQETFGVTCNNDRGEILVSVTGGQAPYTVTLSAPGVTPQIQNNVDHKTLFTGLSAGAGTLTYTIAVRDSQGCETFSGNNQVTLVKPQTVSATIEVSPITCIGANNGSIQVKNTQGGSGEGTYHYILKNVTTSVSTPPQIQPLFEKLNPGEYTLTITDAWNCDVNISGITLQEPQPITMEITHSDLIVCYGANDTGFVQVAISGGTPNYHLILKNADTGAQLRSITGVVSTTTIDNLVPNINYEILVTDKNGCVMTQTHTFNLTQMPNITANASQSENCFNDNYKTDIQVRFPKAIDFTKVKYNLNSNDPTTAVPFSRTNENVAFIDLFDATIPSQSITIFYQDTVKGQTKTCSYTTQFKVVNRQSLSLTQVNNEALNTIEVKATGGVTPYQYYFNGNNQGDNPIYQVRIDDPEQIDPNTGKKLKQVNVIVQDAVGCTKTMTITLEYIDIQIPNFFTPDSDGFNDNWAPKNTQNYPYIQTHIFDRYGRKITTINQKQKWDGTYNKKQLPSGDYWYIIEINDNLDKRKFKGNFTLYR